MVNIYIGEIGGIFLEGNKEETKSRCQWYMERVGHTEQKTSKSCKAKHVLNEMANLNSKSLLKTSIS